MLLCATPEKNETQIDTDLMMATHVASFAYLQMHWESYFETDTHTQKETIKDRSYVSHMWCHIEFPVEIVRVFFLVLFLIPPFWRMTLRCEYSGTWWSPVSLLQRLQVLQSDHQRCQAVVKLPNQNFFSQKTREVLWLPALYGSFLMKDESLRVSKRPPTCWRIYRVHAVLTRSSSLN